MTALNKAKKRGARMQSTETVKDIEFERVNRLILRTRYRFFDCH
jgi:hypothetical protein